MGVPEPGKRELAILETGLSYAATIFPTEDSPSFLNLAGKGKWEVGIGGSATFPLREAMKTTDLSCPSSSQCQVVSWLRMELCAYFPTQC